MLQNISFRLVKEITSLKLFLPICGLSFSGSSLASWQIGCEYQNNRSIMLNWKHWGDLWETEKDVNNHLAECENLKRKWQQGWKHWFTS